VPVCALYGSRVNTAPLRVMLDSNAFDALALDVSRLDMAVFSTPEEDVIFDAVTVGNPRYNEDALILLTARRERIPVVTNDGSLTKRCARHGIEVMTPAGLLARLTE
jgi:hypothetical protein